MRAIIRFSLNGDENSSLRNRLRDVLKNKRFLADPGGANTSTWQNHHISVPDYADVIARFWETVAKHSGPGKMDNFWAYCDQWPYPDNIDDQLSKVGVRPS